MGISLGVLGSGGAIIAVPVLVYLFHFDPILATSFSLGIVGLTSLVGAYHKSKQGDWDLKSSWPIALCSSVGLIISRTYLLPRTPEIISLNLGFVEFSGNKSEVIMFCFASLLILVGRKMLRSVYFPSKNPPVARTHHSTYQVAILSLVGSLVGIFAGFIGAGGGFFFIPILSLGLGMSMHKAAGTSLMIIALNSLIGFFIDVVLTKVQLDYSLFIGILIMALIGMNVGIRIASKLNEQKLKKIFASLIMLLGLGIMLDRFFLNHL